MIHFHMKTFFFRKLKVFNFLISRNSLKLTSLDTFWHLPINQAVWYWHAVFLSFRYPISEYYMRYITLKQNSPKLKQSYDELPNRPCTITFWQTLQFCASLTSLKASLCISFVTHPLRHYIWQILQFCTSLTSMKKNPT